MGLKFKGMFLFSVSAYLVVTTFCCTQGYGGRASTNPSQMELMPLKRRREFTRQVRRESSAAFALYI